MSQDTKTGSETLNMDQFNPKKAELLVTAEKFKPILAIEIVDKKTYEQVHEAQMALGETRRQIEETGENMRKDAVAFQKKVIVVQKDLISTLAVKQGEEMILMEDIFKQKKKDYNDAIEKKKEEERKKQEELANNRNQELAKYGYVHDLFDLKIMEEEEFQTLLSEKKSAWETAESERIAREEQEKKAQYRTTKLLSVGLYVSPERLEYHSSELQRNVASYSEVAAMEDSVFDSFIESISKQLSEKREEIKNAQAEQEKKQKELDEREAKLNAQAAEQKRIEDEKKHQEEIAAAAKKAAEDTEARIKKEQDDKIAAEKAESDAKAEAEKQEQIKMQKLKKYKEFLDSIGFKKEEESEWVVKDTDAGREFFKKVGTYSK